MHVGPEGYVLLFVSVFAEQIGLPLPATPVLLAAGALAATGGLNVAFIIIVSLAASLLADLLWYRAGASGNQRINRFLNRHSGSRILRATERLFGEYGGSSLLFAKFIPGLSLALPPLSGMYGMNVSQFVLFDTLGALIWAGGFTVMGYFFGSTLYACCTQIRPLVWLLAIAIVSAAAIGWRRSLSRTHSTQC
jgi:membrane protein DedA with SNARE-associated domain